MIWYSQPLDAVLAQQQVDPATGLTSEEVAERRQTAGPNALDEAKRRTWLQRFLDQMKDTMVIILMLAALVSLGLNVYHAATGGEADWVEPVVILVIVVINGILGVVQESKAEAALAALKTMASPQSKVLRGGVVQSVPSADLVPGDIVDMEAGDLVPADCRLIDAHAFRCDESALTGESVPVEKDPAAAAQDITPLGDRLNMAYAGCAVAYGRARAVVVETGMRTEIGKIASMLQNQEETATPLQRRLARLGKMLGFAALGICAIIFVIGLIAGLSVLDIFMTAVALAVAAIPEGLPAIVTIVLALGVQRMAAKNAIVRRLPAVETLGSASVVCSDKTGTLTQNRMVLTEAYDGRTVHVLGSDAPDSVRALVRLATLCTDGSIRVVDGQEQRLGDPTETAIIARAMQYGMDKGTLVEQHPRLAELPFDSDRKLMTTVHFIEGQVIAVVKGAPDILLSRCTEGDVAAAAQANDTMAADALRVLAVAYKVLPEPPADPRPEELETGLTFAGLLGMIDPPRKEAADAIRECDSAGIRTIMITGDHVVTACAIARDLGILHSDDEAITGEQLAALSDDELFENIRRYRVYARVTPADKIRIVQAWQRAGEVVSMTGDGVNDAPALKAADIGCAMGVTGTEVAKGAADLVLTDDNFATIVSAVKQGRGIYDNIRKAVQFLLSCNLGEIITVFLSMLFFRESPLLPIQLLWVNLVTDGLPALALGMEPPAFDIMRRKPRPQSESLFAGHLGLLAGLQGLMVGLLTLAAYILGSRVGVGGATASIALGESMAFATLALCQLVHAFNVRSPHSLFRVGFFSNKYMLGAFAGSLVLILAVLLIGPLQGIFNVIPLTGAQWGVVAALAVAPLVINEVAKAGIAVVKKARA